jgi:hypothetical protein
VNSHGMTKMILPLPMANDWVVPDWKALLLAEFEAKGKLTQEDVIRVCGVSFCGNPWGRARAAGFVVEQLAERDFSLPAAKADKRCAAHFYQLLNVPSYMQERAERKAS